MKKLFLSIFLFLSFFPVLALAKEEWTPFKDHIGTNKVLKALVSSQGQASYCIDGTQIQVIPDVNKVFQIWFDNVLSYRDIYPDFDKTFKDILPILKRQNKLVLQQCATPFSSNGIKGSIYMNKDIKGFLSQQKGYKFATTKPLLRIAFCKNKECFNYDRIGGSCQLKNVFEKRILISIDGTDPVESLLHELGHALSFGDVKYGQKGNDRDYGYYTTDTLMANAKYLTCDDADGIVSVLYMALNKEKTFYSFCGTRIFEQGKVARWKSIVNTFTSEGRKYRVLKDLNRHFDKPLIEQQKAFREKQLLSNIEESIKANKKIK